MNKSKPPFPDVLQLIAGPLAVVVSGIWRESRICEYFLASLSHRQVWNAYLSVCKTEGQDRESLLLHLTQTSRRNLLKEAFGSVPPGMIGALTRLGPIAQSPRIYLDLFTILSEGGQGAKQIMHTETLRGENILVLAALPKNLRIKRIVKICQLREAQHLGWLAGQLGVPSDELPYSLRTKLEQASNSEEAEWAVLDYSGHERTLPEPPFEASGPLRPLDSVKCLMDAAKRFENCLANYLDMIHQRKFYFYLWEGREPAIVGLRHSGSTRWWSVDQIAGLKNGPVSAGTRNAISDAFAPAHWVYSGWLRDPEAELL